MSKLSREMQTFVVTSVACFDEPSLVAAAVREEFDIHITRQAIEAYDPTKFAGRDLAERWAQLFWTTREAFLADTARVGISHRAVRLRALQRLAGRAEDDGDLDLALKALDQAHREVADVYGRRRETGSKPQNDEAYAARRRELLDSLRSLQAQARAAPPQSG